MNVSLPDQMKDWLEEHLKTAHFSNTSDYIRHLIRTDQERQQAIAELQAEIDEADTSGPARPFDVSEFKTEMRQKYGAE